MHSELRVNDGTKGVIHTSDTSEAFVLKLVISNGASGRARNYIIAVISPC